LVGRRPRPPGQYWRIAKRAKSSTPFREPIVSVDPASQEIDLPAIDLLAQEGELRVLVGFVTSIHQQRDGTPTN